MEETMAVRVLVTGGGGPAGVVVAREAARAGLIPVVGDADPQGAGLHLGHEAVLLPPAGDADYPAALLDTAVQRGCTALVVTVGEELERLAGREGEFTDQGVAAWFPAARTVTACLDKWAFARAIGDVPAPGTSLGGPGALPGPWIVKPRRGRGSRDVYAVHDPEDFPTLLRRVPEPIVQTLLPGREFTADCLIGRDGTVHAAVPRWRTQVRGGIATRGTTFADPRVDALVERLTGALGLTGLVNVQGFLAEDGPARVVEVNPRCSGGLPISLAAGADLVGQYLRMLLGGAPDPAALRYRPGVTTVRSFTEHLVHGSGTAARVDAAS
ncbi:ATP-grasp domain-containing protein [Kitasatospora sp. NA04385]|uniref:ATP-grasp domain-containing protein n=1 Tax=Kitasatospora sp. NA04385 TaxID=2742135 RepID=UPI00159120C9|nr:ATP-grasp domain-containing protein [Kitasatospora sp. NA04385]QKW18206.1 ATP-grasp domain-containing protein [Kitasatospora sp. NA04385]